jgi:bis(5'-nucleosyl)-tetraphosphatase (symmetrical)
MATYAVGDIQGCYHAFQALLARLQFDARRDTLWLVGDLINRGSGSLEVLQWCYEHQDSIKVVLGNHDLHTLVVAHGFVRPHKSDTLEALLNAPDCDQLLDWLRHQPLVHGNGDYLMVHAGLLPQWTANDAIAYANEVAKMLQGSDYPKFLKNMYGNMPNAWSEDLTGWDRLRVITNAMTRLRLCSQEGVMDFDFKGELAHVPDGLLPWFDVKSRRSQTQLIVFGHWSALGLQHRNHVFCLDTGCLWGGKLTAMHLETQAIIQVPCSHLDHPLAIKK